MDRRPDGGHFNHITTCGSNLCDVRDSPIHSFGDCPALVDVWGNVLWPLLQRLISHLSLLLDNALMLPSSWQWRLRQVVLGFPMAYERLSPSRQVRFRVWYMLALQCICESRKSSFAACPPDKLPTVNYADVGDRFSRLLVGFVSDRRAWDGSAFSQRWLDGNSLLVLRNDVLVYAL